jgi:hypothetical protein
VRESSRCRIRAGSARFIEACTAERGLHNLSVVMGNIIDFEFDGMQFGGGFDRVVSIEMFEHVKNYGLLLAKISRWMRDDAKLFVHIFAHRTLAYHFERHDNSDSMSKYFFTGGTMPSDAPRPSSDNRALSDALAAATDRPPHSPGTADDRSHSLRPRPLQEQRRALPRGPSRVFAATDPARRAVLRAARHASAARSR